MSSIDQLLSILELFSETDITLSAEEIAERLDKSTPTTYRYVRALCRAGLLLRANGRYALGPRIITLDYLMRRNDPMELFGRPIMAELARITGSTVVISQLFNDQIVNLYVESGQDGDSVRYGRGQVVPVMRSAGSRVILASLKSTQLRRFYEKHAGSAELKSAAPDWETFRELLLPIRKAGYCISVGELEPNRAGLAAPIVCEALGIVGSVSVVTTAKHFSLFDIEELAGIVTDRAELLSRTISQAAEDGSEPGSAMAQLGKVLSTAR